MTLWGELAQIEPRVTVRLAAKDSYFPANIQPMLTSMLLAWKANAVSNVMTQIDLANLVAGVNATLYSATAET